MASHCKAYTPTSLCTACCALLHVTVQKLVSYLKLARIHNMVPSMLLVVVGAWVSPAEAASAKHDSHHSGALHS